MLENWLMQATSPGGILAFVLGAVTAILWHGVVKPWWERRHGQQVKRVTIKLGNMILAIGALAVVWTGVRYTELATEVARCQAEFNGAIKDSRAITALNDELSVLQGNKLAEKNREETEMWIMVLSPPDPRIAALDLNDPRREEYAVGIIRGYSKSAARLDAEIKVLAERRLGLISDRPPLPEPTCGRPE